MRSKISILAVLLIGFLIFNVSLVFSQEFEKDLIQNLNKITREANEKTAQANIKTIIVCSETYTMAKGNYPTKEEDLVNAPVYMEQTYNNKNINGYKYSVEFTGSSYKIISVPTECGVTGDRIFTAETGKEIIATDCKEAVITSTVSK